MYCEGKGVSRGLKLSEAFARKARALHADCGLLSNQRLVGIAIAYIQSGAQNEADDILLGIMQEADEGALDAYLCDAVAAFLYGGTPYFSAVMYARSFYYGRIESAISASYEFSCCENPALSKLWLDIACKAKTLYDISQANNNAKPISWQRYEYEESRNDIRSRLREMRNSCGGCGAALDVDRRKYCRCCRTYCYCNEDCQKRHWEDGHREECKEVEEHMRNIVRAIRLGRFDWIQKME